MKQLVTALALATACALAFAQTAREWGQATLKSYDLCSFQMSASFIFGDQAHYDQTKRCVEQEAASAKAGFQRALQAVPPSAAPMVKDYYAAWIAGNQALASLQYGSKPNADRSTSDTKRRLVEMWARIEIEAGL